MRPTVLIVEDSPVNQRVAVGLLEKLGYAAHVVSDGLQGLAALEQHEYAVVLMDCLMPEMDGYTATAELRRREAATGRPHIPVIALTASARPEDRRRCLESGMDDFLSKPIRGASLEAVLDRWISGRLATADPLTPRQAPRASTNGHVGGGTLDRGELTGPDPFTSAPVGSGVRLNEDALRPIWELEALGRPGLFDEMLDLFRKEGAARLVEIREAAARPDAQVLYRLAHTMKGEALAWGATDLVKTSRRLEERSHDGSSAEVEPLLADLERLFEATLDALNALRPTPA